MGLRQAKYLSRLGGVCLASALACSAPQTPSNTPPVEPSSAKPTPPAAAATTWAELLHLPPLIRPELEGVYLAALRRRDPSALYYSHTQTPPPDFHQLPSRARSFPGGRASRVRGFRYAGDHAYPLPLIIDATKRGCGGAPLASDGTLCPSVEFPGVELTDAQAATLFEIVNTKNDTPRAVMNGFQFSTGFVVYDAKNKPIAELLVDADGIKLFARPAVTTDSVDTMMPARRQRIAALLREVGLWPTIDPKLSDALDRQVQLDGERHIARVLPFSSGVRPDANFATLSDDERSKLCLWLQLVWERGSPGVGERVSGIECEDGWRVIGKTTAECRSTMPTNCTTPVGEVETCMRLQRFDPCHAEAPRCRALRDCLWGFRAP